MAQLADRQHRAADERRFRPIAELGELRHAGIEVIHECLRPCRCEPSLSFCSFHPAEEG
jgi:hypothetical protein